MQLPEETEEVTPLDASLHAFWRSPATLPELALHFDEPQVAALPVKRLAKPPFWRASTPRTPDFAELMEMSYIATSAYASRLIMGEIGETGQTGKEGQGTGAWSHT